MKDDDNKKNRKATWRILRHVAFGIVFYLAFSYSLFLGLQVNTTYGNIGVALTLVFLVLYIVLSNKIKH